MKMTSHLKQAFLVDLQRQMQERGWNISKISDISGVHQSQVSRIVAGDFRTFGSSMIKICMKLDMDAADYCLGTQEDDDRKRIANSAISIWDGSRRDAALVVSLLSEIAKFRNRSGGR